MCINSGFPGMVLFNDSKTALIHVRAHTHTQPPNQNTFEEMQAFSNIRGTSPLPGDL